MNCDLEGDLAGCAEMRAFAESLRAAPQARVDDGFADRVMAAVGAEKKPRAKWRMPPLGVLFHPFGNVVQHPQGPDGIACALPAR